MTSRELLLATMRGEKIPRMGWAPFLTFWWDHNRNPKAEAKGEMGFTRSVGADLLLRGHRDRPAHDIYEDLYPFRKTYERSRVEERIEGRFKYQNYITPVGELLATYTYSPTGDTWFLTGHPVKQESDFEILRYLMKDQILEPDTGCSDEIARTPDALVAPLVSPLVKTGFQSMIEHWVGTEEMAEYWSETPEEIEKTLAVMYERSAESARICAESEAEVFLSWEDTSTTNISPTWYKEYILPEINAWCDILHAKGKMYMQHACGHLKALAPLIGSSKIDALESVSSPPTGNTNIVELSRVLPERITLIGGLEPTFLFTASDEALQDKLDELVEELWGRRVILANADSCPPMVDINRFATVTRYLCGKFNVAVPDIEVY